MKIKKLKRVDGTIVGFGVCAGVNGQEVVIVAGDMDTLEMIWKKMSPTGTPPPINAELVQKIRVSAAT